jgi:DNA-binding CsgD family transcriptional regulator
MIWALATCRVGWRGQRSGMLCSAATSRMRGGEDLHPPIQPAQQQAWSTPGGCRPSEPLQRAQREARELSLRVLTITLAVMLWLSAGSVALAAADGLGEHPARRFSIGLGLVVAAVVALWQRERVCAALRLRPQLVFCVAVLQLGAAAADGLLDGPYVAVSVTAIGLAALAARARTVWACVGVLVGGYVSLLALQQPPADIWRDGQVARVLGDVLAYPLVAVLCLALTALFGRYVSRVDDVLDEFREGAPALTSALTLAVQRGRTFPELPSPRPQPLTASERRVVDALARGMVPKQIARDFGVSLATVRTHIRNAKRKIGARTLSELVRVAAQAHHRRTVGLGES